MKRKWLNRVGVEKNEDNYASFQKKRFKISERPSNVITKLIIIFQSWAHEKDDLTLILVL